MAKTEEEILKTVISSALWLIARLLENPRSDTIETGVENINPLGQIALAVETLKAQTTKLALLSQNEPYTPGELTKIIRSLSELTLPSLVGCVQQTRTEDFSNAVCKFIQSKVDSILREMTLFLGGIPKSRADAEAARLNTPEALKSTGVIWEMCDTLNAGLFGGVASIVVKRAQDHLEIIEDALKEIKEWKDSGPSFDDNEDENDFDSDEDEDVQDLGNELGSLSMTNTFSAAEEKNLSACIGQMHHISLIFPPVIKRRIKRFRLLHASSNISEKLTSLERSRLDSFLAEIAFTEDRFDDTMASIYDRDFEYALRIVRDVGDRVSACGQSFKLDWSQESDEFTDWFAKWNAKWQRIRPKSNTPSTFPNR